ncbi:MAG TPA: hypothetical protein ENI44_03030, partial [Thermoplasmatales archaeon]|nr:hypothetical protein [Thermoplasmatales archaeon]
MLDRKSLYNVGKFKKSIFEVEKQKRLRGFLFKCLPIIVLLISLAILSPCVVSKSTDPIGVWHFDEMKGNALIDSSSNHNNGKIYGATWSNGVVSPALKFDNRNDYVEIPNTNGVYNLVDSWTIMAWVKPFTIGWDARNDPIIWKIARNGLNEDTFYLA